MTISPKSISGRPVEPGFWKYGFIWNFASQLHFCGGFGFFSDRQDIIHYTFRTDVPQIGYDGLSNTVESIGHRFHLRQVRRIDTWLHSAELGR